MTEIRITTNTSGSNNTNALRATLGLMWMLLDPATLEVIKMGEGMCEFPADRIQDAQDAALLYAGKKVAQVVATQAVEAAKVTLEVRNVGKSQGDFKRANATAKSLEGVFSGKTWMVRVTPAQRTDLERNNLKIVGAGGTDLERAIAKYGTSSRAWEMEDESAYMTLFSAGY